MKRLVITALTRAEPLPDTDGAFLELQTSEGPLELRLTYDEAAELITALQQAQSRFPPRQKPVARWETAIDPVNQDAVIRAHYADRSAQETRIPRSEVPAIADFLQQAKKRFDGAADMRQ